MLENPLVSYYMSEMINLVDYRGAADASKQNANIGNYLK